tara:strand:- start:351 stop:497 length:147 start_codon:yes stop_codon:yes gene_type:complete
MKSKDVKNFTAKSTSLTTSFLSLSHPSGNNKAHSNILKPTFVLKEFPK